MPCPCWPMGRTQGPGTGTGAGRARHGNGAMRAGPCLGRALSGRVRVSPAGLAHLENFNHYVTKAAAFITIWKSISFQATGLSVSRLATAACGGSPFLAWRHAIGGSGDDHIAGPSLPVGRWSFTSSSDPLRVLCIALPCLGRPPVGSIDRWMVGCSVGGRWS